MNLMETFYSFPGVQGAHSTSLLAGRRALQIPELEAHIFTPKLSRSESYSDAEGIFVTCSLEALWRQPGPMLPAAVLGSPLPAAKQFPCFPTLPGSQYSERGWAERIHWLSVLSLGQPQNSLTPDTTKQQIPFPKSPSITSLLQGLPTSKIQLLSSGSPHYVAKSTDDKAFLFPLFLWNIFYSRFFVW